MKNWIRIPTIICIKESKTFSILIFRVEKIRLSESFNIDQQARIFMSRE